MSLEPPYNTQYIGLKSRIYNTLKGCETCKRQLEVFSVNVNRRKPTHVYLRSGFIFEGVFISLINKKKSNTVLCQLCTNKL